MLPLSVLLCLSVPAPVQADAPPDPRAILDRMGAALRAQPALAYACRTRGMGAATAWPSFDGRVELGLRREGERVPARLALRGEGHWPGREDPVAFAVAFDGRAVRWLRHAERELVERAFLPDGPRAQDWGSITGHFGRAGSELLLWPALGESDVLREGDTLEYEGSIVADGVLCDLVYVERSSARPRWTRWLVGRTDGLPRRRESGWIGEDGKPGAIVASYSGWVLRPSAPSDAFGLALPAGYEAVPWTPPKTERTELLPVGSVAPDFALEDEDGRQWHLSDFAGKVVLIDFWSTSCVPCRRAMAHAQELHERHGAAGLVVLGIDAFESPGGPDPVALFARLGNDYRLLLDGTEVAGAYRVSALPTVYLIDRTGRVARAYRGLAEAEPAELERRVVELLDGR